MANKRKRIVIPLVISIIIGFTLVSNSKLENTRNIDMLQLIVFGMALGVLIVNLKTTYFDKQ